MHRPLLIILCVVFVSCSSTPKDVVRENRHLSDILGRVPSRFDLTELTIARAHAALRAKTITCQGLIRRYLKRIDAYGKSSELNAIIYKNPKAIDRAGALDAKFALRGKMKKLHCIPVILKDNYDTADMPTEAGSVALKGSIPPDDAFLVRRLRKQDAIILAKSNMGEWAFSPNHTISSTYGETRNAYDRTKVPAGSSGGTASAIAANLGIIGMGTSTGNSIRGPAAHSSLIGIRATMGVMSRDGIVPLLYNRDVGGPLMRTVTDTAVVFSVLAGPDAGDPLTEQYKERIKKDYTVYLTAKGLQGARLGVLRVAYESDTTHFEITDLMDVAITDLRRAGAVVLDPFEIKDFEKLRKATGFCSRFRYDLNNYLKTLGPSAPVKSLEEVVEKKLFREQNKGFIKWAMSKKTAPEKRDPPCVGVQADPRRKNLLDAVVSAMDAYNLDAIIYPSWRHPPRAIGDYESPHQSNSLLIAPHTGQPSITVPMGYTSGQLPAGLEFLARPFDEHKLFQYAYSYEQATQHRKPPKGFK